MEKFKKWNAKRQIKKASFFNDISLKYKAKKSYKITLEAEKLESICSGTLITVCNYLEKTLNNITISGDI